MVGVWVGGEERYIHFNTMTLGQGAKSALPMYGKFMQKVYGDPSLGYSQSAVFDVPVDSYYGGGGHTSSNNDGGGEHVEGVFD